MAYILTYTVHKYIYNSHFLDNIYRDFFLDFVVKFEAFEVVIRILVPGIIFFLGNNFLFEF